MPLYKVPSPCLLSAQGQQTHKSMLSSLWDVDAWAGEGFCCGFSSVIHSWVNHVLYLHVVVVELLSHVQLFATPGTVDHQILLSMGFPGKNTGVGCHFLLQRIFATQGWNSCLLHWQAASLPLSHQSCPTTINFMESYICDRLPQDIQSSLIWSENWLPIR